MIPTSIAEARTKIQKLKSKIDSFKCKPEICSKQIDWGPKKKGQGKRVGHMVTGSMSAAPCGIKTYYGIDLSKYITTKKERENIKNLSEVYRRVAYDRARQFGCNHIEAMVYAYL